MNGNVELADLEGLPKELLAQLCIGKMNDEFEILDILSMAPEGMILDKLMIGLYQIHGRIYKRNVITAKLYRMAKKGLVESVKKRKGLYKKKTA